MPAIDVHEAILRKRYPNMCGAVLHIPVLRNLVAQTLTETDALSLPETTDDHVDRYCISDAGHEGDHVVWVPNGAWIAAYEHLPAGWSHQPAVAKQLALWIAAGRPYPPLGGASWA